VLEFDAVLCAHALPDPGDEGVGVLVAGPGIKIDGLAPGFSRTPGQESGISWDWAVAHPRRTMATSKRFIRCAPFGLAKVLKNGAAGRDSLLCGCRRAAAAS
jgi:hypothetical protein